MADQSIELTAYDPTWPVRFAEQQTRLAALLKPWLAGEIEHVGSTSVPGLRSKSLTRNRNSCISCIYLSVSGIRTVQDGAPRAGPMPDTAMPRRCRSSPRSLLPAAGCGQARRMFARRPSAEEAGKSLWSHLVA